MKLFTLILVLILPLVAYAQEKDIPKPVLNELVSDLSQLQQMVLEARRMQETDTTIAERKSLGFNSLMVTKPSTSVHVGATEDAAAIMQAAKGRTFSVIDKAGEWYAVELPEATNGFMSGWIKAGDAVPMVGIEQFGDSLIDPIIQKLVEQSAKVKKKWESNPYISITGFSIDLLPPNLSLNFEFKN